MKLHAILLASAVLFLESCGRSSLPPFPSESVDSICQKVFPADLPGAEVLIMQADSVVFDRCYGSIEKGAAFNIASCSKQFTAVAVLQLAAADKIDINAPVHRYFPEFESSVWDSVCVCHLLSHSSGVPDERGYLPRERKIYGDEQLATEYLYGLDHLHFCPGTDYEYINPTYVLLGLLVERVSGQPFVEYVRDHLFLPAGMTATAYLDPADSTFVPRWVHAYEYADTSDMPEERTAEVSSGSEPHDWFEYDYGEETFFGTRPDGGIYTSVNELVRWEQALRHPEVLGLTEAQLGEAWLPKTRVSGSTWSDYQNRPGTYYGYGWFIEPEKGCIYHTGDNGGFKILIARYPLTKTLVVVLANRADWDRYALKTAIEEVM